MLDLYLRLYHNDTEHMLPQQQCELGAGAVFN